jgi:type I restriction enzyme R subunit
MQLHREIHFEDEICQTLAAQGWRYDANDATNYDRARALYPPDVIAWVEESQPKVWETLTQKHVSCLIRL